MGVLACFSSASMYVGIGLRIPLMEYQCPQDPDPNLVVQLVI